MTSIKRLWQQPVALPALLYTLVSLACTRIPLLNYLGYEFSLVIALLSTFVAGFLTIKSTNQWYRLDTAERLSTQRAYSRELTINLCLLFIPLLVILTNALFVKNCSLLQGVGFFLLIPAVTVIFSTSLGFFCSIHYRWARTCFALYFLATVAYTLALGYFTPAIFSYNFFYGYFPGLTYDEALGISMSLVWFRLLTLVLSGVILWTTFLLVGNTRQGDSVWRKGAALVRVLLRGRSLVVTCLVALLLGGIWWYKGELGFESHAAFIQQRLGERYQTKHFVIFYSRSSYDDEEIRWIAAEHEFRLKQIADELALPFKGMIESYVYPSSETKLRLMGAGNTNIAKPWSGQIHITKQSLDATLKHELVHVLAAPFGVPVIRASLSTGLVEGLAMAIEWEWGNRTPHQYAAAMKKFGINVDISSMMTITGFASQSSSISYVLAGSFCRYLIDTRGIRSMMQLYRTNDYEKIYGKPLESLIAEWRQFLDTIPVEDRDRDAIDVLFRRPPIFGKVCARVLAARNAEAAGKFSQREYESAAALYHQSYQDGHGYDALSGYMASALYARNFPEVIAVFDTVIRQNPGPYLPLMVNAGLAEYWSGNIASALDLFRRVEAADLGENLTEASLVCINAAQDTVNRPALLNYLLSAASDSQRVVSLDSMTQQPGTHWLPVYLKGKVLLRLHRWSESLTVMQQLDPRVPEDYLEAIRLRTIGHALFRLSRFEEAKSMYWQSLNFDNADATKNMVNDWIERCEWMEGSTE